MTSNRPSSSKKTHWSPLSALGDIVALVARRAAKPPSGSNIMRLLGEGSTPIRRLVTQTRNHQEIRNLLDAGTDVIFIGSYFRSGNTWMRCLLSDILLQNRGVETCTSDSCHTAEMAPDVYCELVSADNLVDGEPMLVKTHEPFGVIRRLSKDRHSRKTGEIGVRGRIKVLYLYRDPVDVLVSFFHFRLLKSPVVGRFTDLEAFCRSEFPGWVRHVSSYVRASDEGAEVFFMSYEQMMREPAPALASILHWMDVPHTPSKTERAIANMQFGKLRALEENQRAHAREYFFRKGRVGSGATELCPESVQRIRDGASVLLARVEQRGSPRQSGSMAGPAPLQVVKSAHYRV